MLGGGGGSLGAAEHSGAGQRVWRERERVGTWSWGASAGHPVLCEPHQQSSTLQSRKVLLQARMAVCHLVKAHTSCTLTLRGAQPRGRDPWAGNTRPRHLLPACVLT